MKSVKETSIRRTFMNIQVVNAMLLAFLVTEGVIVWRLPENTTLLRLHFASAFFALLTFGFVIVGNFRLHRSLSALAGNLSDASNQVSDSSSTVASASQSLAEGASEQAASLEETSSSLEEMSSMTRQNADSAGKAKDLASQARQAADLGASDMVRMSAAMEAIKTSSGDIAKIIKTIDEIAFQTNIMALNAAVEAARAGEQGRARQVEVAP